ncbi:xanthine dehydrogenase family protein molybdopterin-binding subunit [Lucifera butyrica]|uniref:xanthine dehydrogenase family protein molybdopterin-binding subunit n=1 Tax=Lucifera butyrica TaxID=1351585 RepID=UPI001FB4BC93|nr:xanthine dehydrogenase family protein molybdopterin-binding subunit [Lucifera butyrica]
MGKDISRIESNDKITGNAKYNADYTAPNLLYSKIVTSPYAHAEIISIDTGDAAKAPGVQAVLTGEYFTGLYGQILGDRPVLAAGKVRYYGEPVALVVAYSELEAIQAALRIKVEYRPLTVVNSLAAALKPDTPLIHENLGFYSHVVPEVYPEPGSNIAHRVKIRKGNMEQGWAKSEVIVEGQVVLPQSDHAAMETRSAIVEILQDGRIIVHSATQGPFAVKHLMSTLFSLDMGKIIVKTGLVGGSFGAKTTVQAELLAYLGSRAAGGRPVKVTNTREEDIISAPGHIGVEAIIKLGATKAGKIMAAEMIYFLDCGAYTDSSPTMAKAIAGACTGPYKVLNVQCDAVAVYTNHPYVTAYRGFGHGELTFAVERMMDKLAAALEMDPLELRLLNAIAPGDSSPTREKLYASNLGNVTACIQKLKGLIRWEEGQVTRVGKNLIRAKGLGCFWKTSSSPVNAISGAILSMNRDGSINLNCGVVELGQGTKTALAQIAAEKLNMDIDKIHVAMEVNTEVCPEHWKTVASKSTYMAGRAVLEAANELIRELKSVGAIALRCPPEDLAVGNSRVHLNYDPGFYVEFKDIAHGFRYPNGNAMGGQIMGRGSYIMTRLSTLDPSTGYGKPGPGWTVGCQAVEVELDSRDFTYKILRAATVIDVGKAINPKNVRCVLRSGMCMGLSLASREELVFDQDARVLNPQLRTYKLIRFGEQPEYLIELVETPQLDAPYGQRGVGEHGLIGMPAALANALSAAAGTDLDRLPLTPEAIWKAKIGGSQ